jgi:hypothetical protein
MPALPDGETAVILVELTTVKLAAFWVPNFTAVAPVKFVPVISTVVFPLVEPVLGVIELTDVAAL